MAQVMKMQVFNPEDLHSTSESGTDGFRVVWKDPWVFGGSSIRVMYQRDRGAINDRPSFFGHSEGLVVALLLSRVFDVP